MTNQKPIEPLPSRELIIDLWASASAKEVFATLLAQWGFNQHAALNNAELQKARDEELEACCDWLITGPYGACIAIKPGSSNLIADLRTARRPKPPSQAEEALNRCNDYIDPDGIIRAALERLRELEGNQ